jgi:hypothetical protein
VSGRTESDSRDDAYLDRNLLAVALVRMAYERGFEVGRGPEVDGYVALYVQLPAGQVSWHVPVHMVPPDFHDILPPANWDGHDLEEKRRRIREYAEEA